MQVSRGRRRHGRRPITIALLSAGLGLMLLPGASSAVVQTAGNDFYRVHVEDAGNSLGRYTATTGANHPQGPGLNVLYGDGFPGTTFDSVRSFTSGTNYTQGAGGTNLGPLGSVTPLGTTGFRTTYAVPGPDALTIVQDFDVVGDTFENSRIIRQTSITNNGQAPLSAGIRYLWDYEIGSDDGPTFQTLDPDGSALVNEADFAPPGFQVYRIVDNDGNPNPPTFAVLGTALGPTTLSPPPTPPTTLKYADWPDSVGTQFDYNTSGQNVAEPAGSNDSAAIYWWGHDPGAAITIPSGGTVSVNAQIVLTTPTGTFPAPAPEQPTVGGPPGACSNQVLGTSAKDTLKGTDGPDLVKGLASNDVLDGGAGDDCVKGGPGKDSASGGDGDDQVNGGQRPDQLSGGAGDDLIKAAAGTDRDVISCGGGDDTVRAEKRDKVNKDCETVTTR